MTFFRKISFSLQFIILMKTDVRQFCIENSSKLCYMIKKGRRKIIDSAIDLTHLTRIKNTL
jgi:hypothetical protein